MSVFSVVIRCELQTAVFFKHEWRPLSMRRPLPVKVLKKEAGGAEIVLPKYSPTCLYMLSVGPLTYMLSRTKIHICPRVHMCLYQTMAGNLNTTWAWKCWHKLPLEGCSNIFVLSLTFFFSLTTQSQAVSDGGKNQAAFPVTLACLCVNVCFQRKSLDLVSLSVTVCLLINGCACTLDALQNWTCLHGTAEAAAPAFPEPHAGSPARWTECWAGPCLSRSCWRTPAESTTSRWAALDLAACCDAQQAQEQFYMVFLSPQTFLRSEVSAENILFWQACEKFRQIPAGSLAEVQWMWEFVIFVSWPSEL